MEKYQTFEERITDLENKVEFLLKRSEMAIRIVEAVNSHSEIIADGNKMKIHIDGTTVINNENK